MTTISRDEWLKALTEAGMANPDEHDDSAVTIREFAQMMGLAEFTAATHLRNLEAAGKATRTRKRLVNSYGRTVAYIAYRLIK